jgi:hypothetical protein
MGHRGVGRIAACACLARSPFCGDAAFAGGAAGYLLITVRFTATLREEVEQYWDAGLDVARKPDAASLT